MTNQDDLRIEVWINGPTDMHGNFRGNIYYQGHEAGYISAEPEAWTAIEEALKRRNYAVQEHER